MAAPKNPNTASATAAVRRLGQNTKAHKLREAGWAAIPPETIAEMLSLDDAEAGRYLRVYVNQWRQEAG
jgi:hypothetical protein